METMCFFKKKAGKKKKTITNRANIKNAAKTYGSFFAKLFFLSFIFTKLALSQTTKVINFTSGTARYSFPTLRSGLRPERLSSVSRPHSCALFVKRFSRFSLSCIYKLNYDLPRGYLQKTNLIKYFLWKRISSLALCSGEKSGKKPRRPL